MCSFSFNSLTHSGIEALVVSLWGYDALIELHLDNNSIADRGAQYLASVLPTTQMSLLNVGFNKIGSVGMVSLMQQVAINISLRILVLSGNRLELEGGHAVATAVGRNTYLKELFLDHTELSQVGQCHVTTELVNNRYLALNKITGFELGLAVAQLRMPGLQQHAASAYEHASRLAPKTPTADNENNPSTTLPPATIEACSNEVVLQYIRLLWQKTHPGDTSRLRQSHDQHLLLTRRGKCGSSRTSEDSLENEAEKIVKDADSKPENVFNDEPCTSNDGDNGFAAAAAAAAASVMMSANSLARLEQGLNNTSSLPDSFLEGVISENADISSRQEESGSTILGKRDYTSGATGIPSNDNPSTSIKCCDDIQHALAHRREEASDAQLLADLNEIAKLTFDSAELWELHQFYFSPPRCVPVRKKSSLHVDREQKCSDQAVPGKRNEILGEEQPPYKRHRSHLKRPIISRYPRVFEKLQKMKGEESQLKLLRQLRFLEGTFVNSKIRIVPHMDECVMESDKGGAVGEKHSSDEEEAHEGTGMRPALVTRIEALLLGVLFPGVE